MNGAEKGVATRARDERIADIARICFGGAGIVSFVGGCVAIGFGGVDAGTSLPLVIVGLMLHAASVVPLAE